MFLGTNAFIWKKISLSMMNVQMDKIAGVIPARWASSRFPGKPLALIGKKPMILHVWERCCEAGLGQVIIATDDSRIRDVAKGAGAEVVMTDPALPSGTDRCAAVAKGLSLPYVINIQGDEPFIAPGAIRQVGSLLQDVSKPGIATLARTITDTASLFSNHLVKVVCNQKGHALYFSRQAIPGQRDAKQADWLSGYSYLAHIGIYGFQREVLLELTALEPTPLERLEQLEQLRWMDHGYSIAVGITEYASMGIDTPEDLQKAELVWQECPKSKVQGPKST